MKLMKLGTRPHQVPPLPRLPPNSSLLLSSDEIATARRRRRRRDDPRSVHTEVPTDLEIQVDRCVFRLHKFPLLSKCRLLRALCATGSDAVELRGFPGGAGAFEACAKFCYGVAITVGAHNVVPLRCAAGRLGMTDDAGAGAGGRGGGSLAAKLDAFLASCLLRRWRDAIAVLRSAGRCGHTVAAECEELGVTSRCVEAVAMHITDPARNGNGNTAVPALATASSSSSSSPWWARDLSDLRVDLFWRVMVAVKAAGTVKGIAIGDALRAYARRWLPPTVATSGYLVVDQTDDDGEGSFDLDAVARSSQLLVEKLVSLLPAERGAVSCGFLLELLKAANVLGASPASRAELTRRAALQLEDAGVSDLLIPSCDGDTLYDVDAVVAILEELALRQAAAAAGVAEAASPAHPHARGHRRSRSAESSEFEGARRSTSAAASHGAMVRIGRLVDGFLVEVAKDPGLPLDKMVAIAEAVPDCARPEHDHLYRAVDTYLRVHPEMDKRSRKKLCRVLNCRKLSETASMHAAQNELLPLRVLVQVLFFENARAAAALSGLPGANSRNNGRVAGVAGGVRALLGKTRREADCGEEARDEQRLRRGLAAGAPAPGDDNDWTVEGLKRAASRISTLRMKLEEDEDADDEAFVVHRARAGAGLVRSTSARVRALCPIAAGKPKRMLSRLSGCGRRSRTEPVAERR